MKNSFLIAYITITVIMISLGCSSAIRYDGHYEGRVIDADTGEPIEGVVVLGVWYKETPTPAGAVSSYYDARETVTDKNGEFEIPGMGLKILSTVAPMNVLIFKAGYEYIDASWVSFKIDEMLKKKITWEGKTAIIPLRKLTMDERSQKGSPDFSSQIPGEKMELMLKEINNDRLERGLDPYRLKGNR